MKVLDYCLYGEPNRNLKTLLFSNWLDMPFDPNFRFYFIFPAMRIDILTPILRDLASLPFLKDKNGTTCT